MTVLLTRQQVLFVSSKISYRYH